jgi:hypothetical protein
VTPNPSIEGMPKRLRLLVTPHVKRSASQHAAFVVKYSTASVLLFPTAALAQARGGSCNSVVCNITGGIVLAVLLLLLAISLYWSIKERGFWRGIAGHRAIQWLAGYVAILLVAFGVPLLAALLWGAQAALWALGALCFGVFVVPALVRRLRPQQRLAAKLPPTTRRPDTRSDGDA